jgi:hypothetical protein
MIRAIRPYRRERALTRSGSTIHARILDIVEEGQRVRTIAPPRRDLAVHGLHVIGIACGYLYPLSLCDSRVAGMLPERPKYRPLAELSARDFLGSYDRSNQPKCLLQLLEQD